MCIKSTNSPDSVLPINREPVENLECQVLIDQFEAQEDKIVEDERKIKRSKKKPPGRPPKSSISTIAPQRKPSNGTVATTLNHGLSMHGLKKVDQEIVVGDGGVGQTAEKILGASDIDGELVFMIKWYVCAVFITLFAT